MPCSIPRRNSDRREEEGSGMTARQMTADDLAEVWRRWESGSRLGLEAERIGVKFTRLAAKMQADDHQRYESIKRAESEPAREATETSASTAPQTSGPKSQGSPTEEMCFTIDGQSNASKGVMMRMRSSQSAAGHRGLVPMSGQPCRRKYGTGSTQALGASASMCRKACMRRPEGVKSRKSRSMRGGEHSILRMSRGMSGIIV